MSFPQHRPRRLRTTPAMRRLTAEYRLDPAELILPAFVREGITEPNPLTSMPGVVQHTMDSLKKAAGADGIDVYFDNVGGEHLEAALSVMNRGGRVAMCGAISVYNDKGAASGPRNLALAIGKEITLRGFLVGSYSRYTDEFNSRMAQWLQEGAVSYDETFVDGLENAPQAFIDLMKGANKGKMVVNLG